MTPPEPTRMRRVRVATSGIRISGAAPASPGVEWCSASQVAVVAEAVGGPREVQRLPDRLAGGLPVPDR